ncbi:putative sugar (and other) transporter [Lyophyllum shimeji]|uniref:Sugar (And other) transporter n=1 Tax=Lyophyllum shimeji TaxID=47721 RepID=A0A9P3PNC7_LYOSH|nr:putative sugar (and other) transporter [Lyophyllum shimeji]
MSAEKHDQNNEKTSDDKRSESRVQVQVLTENIFTDDAVDPVYQAKARILNDAIQEIGMGRYQCHWFWMACIVTGLILAPVVNEFHFEGPFLKLGQNIGLLVGAVFWGVGSDVWGRRMSFNITLLITAIFALAAGGSNNSVALCSLAAVWSVGVGGNLPVDSAIFLEFVPASHQYLLTVLSIWWAFGQLLGSLVRSQKPSLRVLKVSSTPRLQMQIAWPLIGNFSCALNTTCPRSSNQGWRYFLFTMGGLMFILWCIRFFLFKLYESPKYLMGRGRDEAAVEVVHRVAELNGRTSTLTVEDLRQAAGAAGGERREVDASAKGAVRRQLEKFGTGHVRSLFATRKLAYSTGLLITLWAFIGLAFPLYNAFVTYYLATRGADFGDGSIYITYRNQVILSVIGVPGALLAGYMVELPILGRRGTLAISTALTGIFILVSTTARTSNALLGWNCAYSFTSNVMYGVLYAITPELFPTKDRGTGNAIVAAANRVFGIMVPFVLSQSPIIALYADLTSSVPIFIAGAIFVASGFIALLLPFESRGRASL